MTVQTILSRKGRNVVTIEPSVSLQNVGRAPHRCCGCARRRSARDRPCLGARHRARVCGIRRSCVNETIATCGEAEPAVSIMERMTTGKFRHILVIERDELVGIVSIGDIVKHRLCEMEQESAALRDYIQSA